MLKYTQRTIALLIEQNNEAAMGLVRMKNIIGLESRGKLIRLRKPTDKKIVNLAKAKLLRYH